MYDADSFYCEQHLSHLYERRRKEINLKDIFWYFLLILWNWEIRWLNMSPEFEPILDVDILIWYPNLR